MCVWRQKEEASRRSEAAPGITAATAAALAVTSDEGRAKGSASLSQHVWDRRRRRTGAAMEENMRYLCQSVFMPPCKSLCRTHLYLRPLITCLIAPTPVPDAKVMRSATSCSITPHAHSALRDPLQSSRARRPCHQLPLLQSLHPGLPRR